MNKRVEFKKVVEAKGFMENLKKQRLFLTSEGKQLLGMKEYVQKTS